MTRTQTVQQITDNLRARREKVNAQLSKLLEAMSVKTKPLHVELEEIDRMLAAMAPPMAGVDQEEGSDSYPLRNARETAAHLDNLSTEVRNLSGPLRERNFPEFLGKHKPSDDERELLAES